MDFTKENQDYKFRDVELECHFCSFLRKSHLYKNKTSLFKNEYKTCNYFFACQTTKKEGKNCTTSFITLLLQV